MKADLFGIYICMNFFQWHPKCQDVCIQEALDLITVPYSSPSTRHSNACFNPMGSCCEDQGWTPNSCGHLDGHLGFNQDILPDLRDKISCSFVSSINSRGLFSYFLSHAHLRPEKPRCWASMHTHWKPRWLLSQVMLLDLKFFFTGKSDWTEKLSIGS